MQYAVFLRNMVSGDLGDSLRQRRPITEILLERLPPTLFLVSYAAVLSIAISGLAAVGALNRGRWQDQAVRFYAILSLAMPAYWIGMMLLQFFAVKNASSLSPATATISWATCTRASSALSLALAVSSILVRSLRNSIIETIGADYVRTARSRKGLSGQSVFFWHVLRNSSMATVTILAVNLAFLIGGTTIRRINLCAVPGIGQLIVKAIFDRDYPIIQGVTLAVASWSSSSIC